jgi:peptidoglycan-associated lipoprotein
MKKIAIILASVLITACSSTPTINNPQASNTHASASNASAITNDTAESGKLAEMQQLKNQVQQLDKQSVYFDLNQSAIKSEYQGVIQQEANFAKSHNDVVTVSGNTDERGSNEYNLALGDRRAQSVAKMLEVLGVSATQIKTVSYGEEKPRMTCHEEKCWQENRRADFDHKVN